MGILGPFGHYEYQGDDGNLYTVRLRAAVADAVGNVAQAAGTNPPPPRKWKLRHIWGAAATAGTCFDRKRAIIGSAANPLFTAGGTFDVDGDTYNVEGRIGEARIIL